MREFAAPGPVQPPAAEVFGDDVIAAEVFGVDVRGKWTPVREGCVKYRLRTASAGAGDDSRASFINDARCEFAASDVAALDLLTVTSEGRRGVPSIETSDASGTPRLRVLVRWQGGVTLSVRDALTLVELQDVCVSIDAGVALEQSPAQVYLESCEVVVGGTASPIPLPYFAGARTLLIDASGYSPRQVHVSGRSGERTVRLYRSGGLEVSVHGSGEERAPPESLELSLLSPNGQLVRECALDSEATTVLEGLPARELRYDVRVAGGSGPRYSAWSGTIQVQAGQRAALILEDVPRAVAGQLEVLLHAGLDLDVEKRQILVFEDSGMSKEFVVALPLRRSAGGDGDQARAGPVDLSPGRYRVELKGMNLSASLELHAGGTSTIELDARAAVEWDVWVVVTGSTEPLGGIFLLSRAASPSERIAPWYECPRVASDPVFRVRALPGPITLAAMALGYRRTIKTFDPSTDPSACTLELLPQSEHSFELTVREAQAEYPVNSGFWERVMVRPLDGAGELVELRLDRVAAMLSPDIIVSARFVVSDPGEYIVSLPALDDAVFAETELHVRTGDNAPTVIYVAP